MASTTILTADEILDFYAEDVAFVAEAEATATTLATFADHLRDSVDALEMAGFEADEAQVVAQYLDDALAATDPAEKQTFMKKACERIGFVGDMASEYRDMC
ncbi:hypothetical protein [Streptomyces sp. NPDC059783]|uniref:hypothetical protein n=1 Tax=Streptomyces sp. NPDC059783 TaxID=3346944 RepID=UPI00364CEC17